MVDKLQVDVYSHGVHLHGITREMVGKLTPFMSDLELKEDVVVYDYVARKEKTDTVIKKRFFVTNEHRNELFTHRNMLDKTLQELSLIGIPYDIHYRDAVVGEDATFVIQGKDPRDYQIPIIDAIVNNERTCGVKLQTGKGKALRNGTLVKCPNGWVAIEDLKVNDTVILPSGNPTTVTGVYPQGVRPLQCIVFEDGRMVDCDNEHLWEVIINGESTVVTTTTLRKLFDGGSQVAIPMVKPDIDSDIETNMDPYIAGVLIGSALGALAPKVNNGVPIDCGQADLIHTLRKGLPSTLALEQDLGYFLNLHPRSAHGDIQQELRGLGLWDSLSGLPHVPRYYRNASYGQRLALLQGLMDASGMAEDDELYFESNSKRLCDDVVHLVRSIGGKAYRVEEPASDGFYLVGIIVEEAKALFRLPMHREIVASIPSNPNMTLEVTDMFDTTEGEATCISVKDESSLYVCADYIVTHNTFCALSAMARVGKRTCLMILPKYFGIWRTALDDIFEAGTYTFEEISGSSSLQSLMQRAVRGDPIPDIVMVSCVTYRNYIEGYERFGRKGLIDLGYPVPPHEFHTLMGFGIQINDEIQDDPGLYFKIDTVTNVKKQVYLSATPFTGNDRLTEMINLMLPEETDAPLPEVDVYADALCICYSDRVEKRDYTGYKKAYSHVKYETELLKNPQRKNNYFGMIRKIANQLFVKDQQKGQKLIVFCATVDMIHKLTKFMRLAFPNQRIVEYVAGSKYEDILTADMVITTLKSAGAGVDIPDVREILSTHATDSKKDNLQAIGRARRMKNYPDATPRFSYLCCTDIPQHLRYANNKLVYFHGRVKSHRRVRISS